MSEKQEGEGEEEEEGINRESCYVLVPWNGYGEIESKLFSGKQKKGLVFIDGNGKKTVQRLYNATKYW